MTPARRALSLLPGRFAVCRFPPDESLPTWLFHDGARVWSLTRTPEELSVVCDEDDLPPAVTPGPERWQAYQIEGPIPFDEIGVIAGITAALAAAGVAVFVISTHDTDLVLVPEEKDAAARAAWARSGIEVREATR